MKLMEKISFYWMIHYLIFFLNLYFWLVHDYFFLKILLCCLCSKIDTKYPIVSLINFNWLNLGKMNMKSQSDLNFMVDLLRWQCSLNLFDKISNSFYKFPESKHIHVSLIQTGRTKNQQKTSWWNSCSNID